MMCFVTEFFGIRQNGFFEVLQELPSLAQRVVANKDYYGKEPVWSMRTRRSIASRAAAPTRAWTSQRISQESRTTADERDKTRYGNYYIDGVDGFL
jgi:hypothetical protein